MKEIKLPLDRSGFVRRRCPHCVRDFKTRPTDEDPGAVQAVINERLQHVNEDETSPFMPGPRCPYCGFCSPAIDQLTPGQVKFLEDVAIQIGAEMQHRVLCQVAENLRAQPRLTFVAVAPTLRALRPPLEADDLHLVTFVCCGEEAKADCPSSSSLHCPRCGVLQQRGPASGHGIQASVLEA